MLIFTVKKRRIKFLLGIVLFLMMAAAALGQQAQIMRIDSLALLALLKNNFDSVQIYTAQGRALSATDSLWAARWDYYDAAKLINKEYDFATGIKLLETILLRQKNLPAQKQVFYAQSLQQQGAVYYYMGDLEQAAKYFKESVEVLKKTKGIDDFNYRSSLNNLGLVYYNTQRYAESEACLTEVYASAQRLGDTASLLYAQTLNNMANLYVALGDVSTAELLHKKGLSLRKQLANGKKTWATCAC